MGKVFGYTPQEVDSLDAILVEQMIIMYMENEKNERENKTK